MDEIISNNDNIKPCIARLMFDSYPVRTKPTSYKDLPFECVSNDGSFLLDSFPLVDPASYGDDAGTIKAHMQSNSSCINPTHYYET